MRWFFIALLTAPCLGLAMGNKSGNGGYGIICSKKGSPHVDIEIFDIYEGFFSRGEAPVYPKGKTSDEKLAALFSRVEGISAELYKFIKEQMIYHEENKRLVEFQRNDISGDLGIPSAPIPENCRVQQLAVQYDEDINPKKSRYEYDSKLWLHLSEDQKAILTMHELVYSYIKYTYPSDVYRSQHVRNLITLILRDIHGWEKKSH